MSGLASFIQDTDPLTLIIFVVILIVTGGVGSSYVTGRMASKRGVQGDALVKEQNGIEGLTNLGTLQGTYIATLTQQIKDLSEKFDDLERKFDAEVEYSNLLINTLSENTVPIPPRPNRKR